MIKVKRAAIAAALALGVLAPAAAQVSGGGTFSFEALKLEGLVVRRVVEVGASYGDQHGVTIPAPFRIAVPVSERYQVRALYPPDLGGGYLKLNFGSLDNQFLENIQFTGFAIDPAPLDQRRDIVAQLLRDKGWPAVIQGYTQGQIDVIRAGKVGAADAVELVGRYVDPQNGLVIARMMAILREGRRDGVLAIANIAAERVALPDLEALDRTISGDVLASFEFR